MTVYGSYREAQRAEKAQEAERAAEEQEEGESEDGPGKKTTPGKSATGQSIPTDPNRRDPEKVFSFGGDDDDDDPAPTPPRADRPTDSDSDSGSPNTDSGSPARDTDGSPEDSGSSVKAEEPTPVSRADFGGTKVGAIDTTPSAAADAPEPGLRPDGEYHDGDSYSIVSTDSNGNRHITRYRVEPDGEVRFGDNYLEERVVARPDGGTTVRSYVHPGLKAAIAELESKAGTAAGLTAPEQQRLAALRGRRNEMSGQVWNEVWDTPETRLVSDLALQLALTGRALTGSSSIEEQRAFNLKKGELLDAIRDLPNRSLREDYAHHYGDLLDATRSDWMRANYQYGSGAAMAQAQANLSLAVERFYAAGTAIPPATNTTPEYQEARGLLVAALNAIPGEAARAEARSRILPILEQQGSDFVRDKVESGAYERGVSAYVPDYFQVTPTDNIPAHSLLSPEAQFQWDLQQRIAAAVAEATYDDLNPGSYYDREALIQGAGAEHNAAVADYEAEKAALEATDIPTPAQVAQVRATWATLLVSEAVLKARWQRLDTFHAGNAEAINLAERDRADRSDFAPQYEFIDPSQPEQKVESPADWNRAAFDLNRARQVLDGKFADLDRRIAEYEATEVKDRAAGNALREEAATLNAEAYFINQVSDRLYQAVTGQERTGDPEADDRTFQQAWPRFAASQVNPYTAHGEAVRRHNFYSDDPIGYSGLLGRDESSDDDRIIYTPEFAAAFGQVTGQRVTGNPEQDNATLDLAWAALDDQLENEFVGTGKVYQQRVLYDAAGNFAGVDPRFAEESYLLPDETTTRSKERATLAWDAHIAADMGDIGFADPDATLTDDRVFRYPEGHPLQGLAVNSPQAAALLKTGVQFQALGEDLRQIDRGVDSFIYGEDGFDPLYNSAEAALAAEEMRIRGLHELAQSGKYRDLELQDTKTGLTMSGEAWLERQIAQMQAAKGVRSFQEQKNVDQLEQENRNLLREGVASDLFHRDRSSANLNPVHVSNRLAADQAVKEAREKLKTAEDRATAPLDTKTSLFTQGIRSTGSYGASWLDENDHIKSLLEADPEARKAAKEYEDAWKFRDGVYLATGWRDEAGLNIHQAQQALQEQGIFETFGVPSKIAQYLDVELLGTSPGDLVGARFYSEALKAEDPLSPGGKHITAAESDALYTSMLQDAPAMALAPLTIVGVGGQLIRVGVRGGVAAAQGTRIVAGTSVRAGQRLLAGHPVISSSISLTPLRTTLVSGVRQAGAGGLKSITDPHYGEKALTYFARDNVALPLYHSRHTRSAGRSFGEELLVEEPAEAGWDYIVAQQTPEFKTALQQGGAFGALQYLDEIYGRRRLRRRTPQGPAPAVETEAQKAERKEYEKIFGALAYRDDRYGVRERLYRPVPNPILTPKERAAVQRELSDAIKAREERQALADRYNLWTPPPTQGRVRKTIQELKGNLGATIAAGMIAVTPYTPATPAYTPAPVHYQSNLAQNNSDSIVVKNAAPIPTSPVSSTSASPSPSPADSQREPLSPSPNLPDQTGPSGLSISPSASATETSNISPTAFINAEPNINERPSSVLTPESSSTNTPSSPNLTTTSPSPSPSASATTTLPAVPLSTPSPASSVAATSISPQGYADTGDKQPHAQRGEHF